MMGIPPSEAKAMSLLEYQALMYRWNEAHAAESDIEPPSIEETEQAFAHAAKIGMLT